MPSNQLNSLCEQIENQHTDHFGKFYMYISLLNTITVRNQSFADGLPKYDGGLAFWRKNHLDVGELTVEFSQEVTLYARQFVNLTPGYSASLYNIAMAYMRKGKLTDLIHIIDKMLHHLNAIHGSQSHNQAIYEYIGFAKKKAAIAEFIEQISQFNHQLMLAVDNAFHTTLSMGATVVGTVLVLGSLFSLASLLVGLGLMLGGAYSAYSFAIQTYAHLAQLEGSTSKIAEKLNYLPRNSSLFGDKNHNLFFNKAIKPLPYAVVTAAEQLAINDEQQQIVAGWRENFDEIASVLGY